MRRLLKRATFLAVALLLVLVVSAARGSTPTRRLKHVAGPITTLAMDGPRVVYGTDGNGVYVWNVSSNAISRVRAPSKSDFPLVQEVATAGGRVAWITREAAGNSQETNDDLFTASIRGHGTKKLAHAFRYLDFVEPRPTQGRWLWNGDWITGLVGSGNVIVVSRWTERPNRQIGDTTISNARLSLINATTGLLRPIASGEESIVSRAVDGGRVAVLQYEGDVEIYSRAGALLQQITPSSAQEIAMGGGRLVVLTNARTIEVYDAQTGTLEHTWPIKTRTANLRAGHLQAYGRIALYSVDPRYSTRDLRIMDLNTGKGLTLPKRTHSGGNDATVGPLGVVYAVNDYRAYGRHHPSGALVLLSTARVLAAIARGHLT